MDRAMTSLAKPTASGFRPPAVPDVDVNGFWGERIDAVADKTVMILYDRCVAAGMFDQIDPHRPVPEIRMPFHTRPDGSPDTTNVQMFWDSDVAKVIEAAAYALYRKPNPDLEAKTDAIIDMFHKLQQPDGYVNSWFIRMQPGKRWLNLRDCHELYCAGHLIEGAVAYFHATGKRKLLDVMCRYADHIDTLFGPKPGQKPGYCGHEEIELALIRLGRTTGEQRYLDLARYFVEQRGQQPHYFDVEAVERDDKKQFRHRTYEYNQSHVPVRDQTKVIGHAVRAMYLYSGMADVATEFGDDSLTDALKVLWDDLTTKQMYVTGGIGPAASNEGFTDYFDLPNETAYAETCASVGLVMWASRMLGRGPDRLYADIMEQALYNGALSGLATDGAKFFYDNPLESRGGHHRWTWHRCPCCPPNIARTVASIGSYMYAVSADEVAVHLYGESTARLAVGAKSVTLTQRTDYPWNGRIAITVDIDAPASFKLALRVPGWCGDASLSIDGEAIDTTAIEDKGYLRIDRLCWRGGEKIILDLPMDVRALHANPAVRADLGRVALSRGPMIYCAEEVDNAADLNGLVLTGGVDKADTATVEELGGAVVIDIAAKRETWGDWNGSLYRADDPALEETKARFIPYYLWDNREPGEMLVWVRTQK
jgi:DUF1680 family protein